MVAARIRMIALLVGLIVTLGSPAAPVTAQGEDERILQAVRGAAGRPGPVISRPVALTRCEIGELRRRLIADREARRLYAPLFRRAAEALETAPAPVARIQFEGILATDPRHQASRTFPRDVQYVEALGLAYAITGEVRYAERAGVFLHAWARTNKPDGNPINETGVAGLVRGASLVLGALSSIEQVESWLSRMATLEIENRGRRGQTSASNNWHSHRLKIVGLIGYVLAIPAFASYAEDIYRLHIAGNLRPDGSSFDFHERDALHYHVYTLEPLVELAIAADKRNIDLYGHQAPSGASLERGIEFLLPYVRGEKLHLEFVQSKVAFDRQRGEAGIPGFEVGAPWDPQRAAYLLELAGYFNPTFASEPIRGQVRRTFQTVLNGLRQACRK